MMQGDLYIADYHLVPYCRIHFDISNTCLVPSMVQPFDFHPASIPGILAVGNEDCPPSASDLPVVLPGIH